MAVGPDPNRWTREDPEAPEELGDLGSTRFGLPSWAIVVIVLLVTAFALVLMY